MTGTSHTSQETQAAGGVRTGGWPAHTPEDAFLWPPGWGQLGHGWEPQQGHKPSGSGLALSSGDHPKRSEDGHQRQPCTETWSGLQRAMALIAGGGQEWGSWKVPEPLCTHVFSVSPPQHTQLSLLTK